MASLVKTAAHNQLSTLLLRHSTRGLSAARLDRYGAIHDFFRTQTRPLATHQRPRPSIDNRKRFVYVFQTIHARAFHRSTQRWSSDASKRTTSRGADPLGSHRSSKVDEPNEPCTCKAQQESLSAQPPDKQIPPPTPDQYSRFFRQLAQSLPHLHRPTRDDFLNAAQGFWQRFKVRFKWFTIRSFRPFNADDISAFVSLLLLSQTVWILVGT
jgi:mitochondrial distribution and morphology protein 31